MEEKGREGPAKRDDYQSCKTETKETERERGGERERERRERAQDQRIDYGKPGPEHF